jgi:phenylalanyl-tRNA synthetase alpha chain
MAINTSLLTEKQRQVIRLFQENSKILSLRSFCERHGLDFNFVKGFVLSEIIKDYLDIEDLSEDSFVLTKKGTKIGQCIPGYSLADRIIRYDLLDVSQLHQDLGQDYGANFGALKKEGAIEVAAKPNGDKENEVQRKITILDKTIVEKFIQRQEIFSTIREQENIYFEDVNEELKWLVRQKFVEKKSVDDYAITVKPELQNVAIKKLVTLLTNELLISGQWKDIELKSYNIDDEVPNIPYGRSSILTQCIQRVREIFLDMGFDEMSGQIVESSFWNFDALFTAQDHPAREIQDTFYLAKPQTLPLPDDSALVQSVKSIHEKSHGSNWIDEEASRAILRTHTTASTARNLYKLKGQDVKYFSIDKVFRNESIDKTHLAEFYQVEGVVVAPNLSVRTLIGYLSDFYTKLGFTKFKFKPTYNPYTEPSLEVYAYHPPSNSFIEVANSGVFRPEMLKSLGYEGKSTVAWGLGLERIAMLLYGVDKLSELVGHGISLNPPQK